MANVFPFPAVHPVAEAAAGVCAPPYDVVTRDEARRKARGNPDSFLHVSRAELGLSDDVSPYSDLVYETARRNYLRLRHSGRLQKDTVPHYYVYGLESATHRQVGVAAVAAVDDYEVGIVRRHETTRPDKVEDRARHIAALNAQTGPVFLAYRDSQEIAAIVGTATARPALLDCTGGDGVRHTVWRVSVEFTASLRRALESLPVLYIADGHHRAESAARVRTERRRDNPAHTGTEPYNRFLAVLFPASQLRILPYNRLVKGLNGLDAERFLAAIRRSGACTVQPVSSATPTAKGAVHMFLDGRWWRIAFVGPSTCDDPVEQLDVQRLQKLVLDPILGIRDPRRDPRIDFVGGIRGADELERLVRQAAADAAFSLFPVGIEEVMTIADAGRIMPPKSTWFEPKLADGLLIHEI
ncbi:MAG: DUF1015 domain-containing protein [Kiritimatiellaeota bacterium]|nr:DUF1015 domain-containing protein [Kiritimatiellota bacterium]